MDLSAICRSERARRVLWGGIVIVLLCEFFIAREDGAVLFSKGFLPALLTACAVGLLIRGIVSRLQWRPLPVFRRRRDWPWLLMRVVWVEAKLLLLYFVVFAGYGAWAAMRTGNLAFEFDVLPASIRSSWPIFAYMAIHEVASYLWKDNVHRV